MSSSRSMPERADDRLAFVDLQAQRARLGDRIERAIAGVLEHGQFIMGPEIARLEAELSEFSGARHAVTCASGTDALLLPLMAWGVRGGDAVFVPAFTFPSTPEVVALLGATPVFVDVDPDTFNLDPDSLGAAIAASREAGLTPAAVIAVDLYGLPADYDAISPLAASEGLRLIGDAAQSFGGSLDGQPVGTLSDVTATSFFPAKPLGCYGDGGAVLTDDDDLADVLRSLRVHGQGSSKYDVVRVGINGRLDTMQAAILLEKLSIFADELEARERVAGRYTEALTGLVDTPTVPDGARSAWAQYTIRVDRRDDVVKALGEQGVPSAVYYPRPLHAQPAYENYLRAPGGLPVSERLAERVLSLPMHPYLDEAQQDRVIAALKDAVA